MGEQHYLPTQQSEGGQYRLDAELTNYVREVGNRLAAVSDTPLPYEFVVLNNSTPNAWALPGGKIAINRGLLVTLESEAELAAVLGHEIVHAAARHGARSLQRSLLLQGAIALTAIAADGNDYENYIMDAAQLGTHLITQRYGRGAELESDYYGMQYMARAGYDPDAAITLQQKFVKLNQGRSTFWLDGLFASHPPSQQRVQKNHETAAEMKVGQDKSWQVGRDRYRQKIAHLKSRADAYAAYDQAVTLANKKETSAAKNRIEQAISLEPREARFYGFKGNLLYNEQRYASAIFQFEQAISRDHAYYEYFLGRGMTRSRLGNHQQARQDLERSNELLPTAIAANELGNLSLRAGDRSMAKQYYAQASRAGGSVGQIATNKYVKLDITDNPARYFDVSTEEQNGVIYAMVINDSSVPVQSGVMRFSAVINGRERQEHASIGALGPGQVVRISSGWRLADADLVDRLSAQVVSVKP